MLRAAWREINGRTLTYTYFFTLERKVVRLRVHMCAAFLRTVSDSLRKVGQRELPSLVKRGLRLGPGLLCVIDGAKGLRTAIRTVFGAQGLIQRCQWHTRENVVRYLPKTQQAAWRRRL